MKQILKVVGNPYFPKVELFLSQEAAASNAGMSRFKFARILRAFGKVETKSGTYTHPIIIK